MEKTFEVQSSNFFGDSAHHMIVWHAVTQYSIRVSPDALVGTDFHSTYTGLLAELNERNESGLPKHSPFKIIDALCELVWKTCVPFSEAYADIEPSEQESLQNYIQPPTLHIALAKDAHGDSGVVAEVIGDPSSNYVWDTARAAQTNSHITNSYAWDIAPVPKQRFKSGTTVHRFQTSDLFIANDNTTAGGRMKQVHTASGTRFFFKPRSNHMAPEFDREVSVLDAIASHGLDRTLKVSPFKGLVLLDSGLVAGVLFEWLEGLPLAEHPERSNPRFYKRWREQVEAIVKELHRHEIVWGDVNVHNVFIDRNDDAWVIDFGGNCNVEFVDEELKETYEGDRQGLRRIFEEWIPLKS